MTQTAAARKVKSKRQRRPIYLRCERLVRPETGESVGAWVPLTKWDARALRDRKYSTGTEVRAEFKKPRNVKFHRLAHAVGAMMVEQVEDFSGLTAHDALKRLQRECGAFCDEIEMQIDLGPTFGKHVVPVKEPRSISFDELDEGSFQELFAAIYKHISATYWPDMDPDAIALMAEAYEVNH
jgi:hypothetical protein